MSTRAHLLLLVATVGILAFIINLVRQRQLRAKYSILWIIIGLGLIAFAASPALLDRVSLTLGISYPPATLFLAALGLLFLVVVHFSWELSRLEERTRRLAEELALFRVEVPADGDPGPASGRSAAGPK
ncbi:MAG: DUF2304 domain-containing protein [Actinobacteria bacterium]|nr:DUF2304 domain-containing protein [Actinomycetota bacterium]